MTTSNLNWHSFKPININDSQRLTISWGTDGNGSICCTRVDIRLYIDYIPTTYGVVLKRWELLQIVGFIKSVLSGMQEKEKVIDELTMEISGEDILLTKRGKHTTIQRKDFNRLCDLIPGVSYILQVLRPSINCYYPARVFEDIFIYASLIKDVNHIDEPWKDEDILKNKKLNNDHQKFLKSNANSMYEQFTSNFSEMALPTGACSQNEFVKRVGGAFLETVSALYSESSHLVRSLIIVLKAITSK